jgi:riboflavin synthase
MFTGIITRTGTIARIEKKGDWMLTIAAARFTHDLTIGASVACSGVCLTVTSKTKDGFIVQVSKESIKRSTIGSWKKGTKINLERALKVGDELGGHIVSGHVDGVVKLLEKKKSGDSVRLTFSLPKPLRPFIAEKGSVTLDGISLTINDVAKKSFSVNIIPHTLSQTTLGARKTGDALNVEIDVVARYLARLKRFS